MRNESMMTGNTAAVAGMLLGAVIGAGVALLLAPATGPDSRRKLGATVRRWGTDLKDIVKERLSHDTDYETKAGQESMSRLEPAAPRSSY